MPYSYQNQTTSPKKEYSASFLYPFCQYTYPIRCICPGANCPRVCNLSIYFLKYLSPTIYWLSSTFVLNLQETFLWHSAALSLAFFYNFPLKKLLIENQIQCRTVDFQLPRQTRDQVEIFHGGHKTLLEIPVPSGRSAFLLQSSPGTPQEKAL